MNGTPLAPLIFGYFTPLALPILSKIGPLYPMEQKTYLINKD